MTKIRIGITDHSPPPFEVEREALGADAEMVFLDSRQEQDYDPEILKSLDALLVWRAKITSKTVDQLERCLLYTSDAADDSLRVDLGGRRII